MLLLLTSGFNAIIWSYFLFVYLNKFISISRLLTFLVVWHSVLRIWVVDWIGLGVANCCVFGGWLKRLELDRLVSNSDILNAGGPFSFCQLLVQLFQTLLIGILISLAVTIVGAVKQIEASVACLVVNNDWQQVGLGLPAGIYGDGGVNLF